MKKTTKIMEDILSFNMWLLDSLDSSFYWC